MRNWNGEIELNNLKAEIHALINDYDGFIAINGSGHFKGLLVPGEYDTEIGKIVVGDIQANSDGTVFYFNLHGEPKGELLACVENMG